MAIAAISHSRSEPLITCDIGKIYDNHFVIKKLAPCQNFDGFDKKHSHGLLSIILVIPPAPQGEGERNYTVPNFLKD